MLVSAVVGGGALVITPSAAMADAGDVLTVSDALYNTPYGSELFMEQFASVTDTDDNGLVTVGDLIDFTFVVTNTGNAQVDSIAVEQASGGAVDCPSTTLAPMEQMTCKAVAPYVVTDDDFEKGLVENSATATGASATNSSIRTGQSVARIETGAPVPTVPVNSGSLSLSKAIRGGTLWYDGDTPKTPSHNTVVSTVRFLAVNNGTEALSEVVLTDQVKVGDAVTDMGCYFPDDDENEVPGTFNDATQTWSVRWEASFGENPVLWEPGAMIMCSAVLWPAEGANQHADIATIQARVPGTPEEPSTPGEPGDPSTPGEPSDPSTPGEPGEPSTPGEPGDPSTPGEPGVPSTPGEPGDPSTPGEPGDPSTPGEPGEPGEPSTPDEPGDPSTPDEPGEPSTPGEPGEPSTPDEPGKPSTPGEPSTPNEPSTPVTPANPSAPKDETTPSSNGATASAEQLALTGGNLQLVWWEVAGGIVLLGFGATLMMRRKSQKQS
ncbi:hypothetical protein G7068_10115 [Leucobacter viscericola]|uniref:DUF7507 domain-containing protein n=1 Tax=Leucobacter viscericola TaxID=2714935 RepID=A0A6G7XG36_9MICO|nr:hypothetical protein [Leucobacter viscericola]QIK63513.1 hypothetical protein G7068_10115 [Leucobacter viscericola]